MANEEKDDEKPQGTPEGSADNDNEVTEGMADATSDGDEESDVEEVEVEATEETPEGHAFLRPNTGSHLNTMYRNWFLDYASYVVLERAVPHLDDGLKPVQRRILHTMDKVENGLYNKVAGIVGDTMHYHPHGDASIYDALVKLGQKDLLIDHQGNWGNILTGDGASAPRYIEARLTKFAKDVVFNHKTTVWMKAYDGRSDEPVTLPIKFPLLLAQGVEGIAVGLSSKILPHNFIELIDASIAYLRGESFELYPDFPTGGSIDVSRYNDGARGGQVRIRAKIEKRDAKTLVITEIPFSKTTGDIMDSIERVNDKKIKVKKIEDITSDKVEILVHLPANTSPDKTIDALYAFTDCEISISPNACVILDKKPHFMSVSEILRHSTDRTVALLKQELEIRLGELKEQWHTLSLEKIFIEERIYKDAEYEQSKTYDEACAHIDKRLEPWKQFFIREVTKDDLMHLFEIKMGRILRFSSDAAEERLAAMKQEMADVQNDIDHIVDFAIGHFQRIKKQYGKGRERRTEIRSFDNIVAAKVAERNKKLYVDREEGFMGYGLKQGDFVSECSDLDDVIIFYHDGRYIVKKIDEKVNIGLGVMHIAIFKKNDTRTVYNAIYTDGETGVTFAKRYNVTGVTRDKEYDQTSGSKGSKLLYFSANANGEAEVVKVLLKPRPKIRNVVMDFDFATIGVKGRGSKGNVVTKNDIHKIVLKRRGGSTLGGQQIWFERETLRLNPDGRGEMLGEFGPDDKILLITNNGEAQVLGTGFEQHFDDNIVRIEKYDETKVWTVVYHDGETDAPYIKRFRILPSAKPQALLTEHAKSKLLLVSDEDHPRLKVTFGGAEKWRQAEEILADEFIAEKGIKAKGKRLVMYTLGKVTELEPLIPTVRNVPQENPEPEEGEGQEGEDQQPSLFS